MKSPSHKFFPLFIALAFIFLVVVFFYPFFIKGLVPMPADIAIGAYFPWLDYKWGTTTGIAIKNPLPSDVPSLLFPNKKLAVELLLSGHLPDWNQFILSGTELFQTSLGGIFHPLNIIYLVTDLITAWSLQVVVQPLVAAISMYLLARYLKLSRTASFFSAVSFAFSGFLITWVEYNAQSQPLALMPLVVFTALKSFDTKRLRDYAFYSLALGIQILAGYPQFVLYTLLFVGVSRLFYIVPRSRDFILLGFFTTLGFAFSAIQLFPLFDLYTASTRLHDSGSLVATNLGFLPFKHLVTLISPNFFGNPATLNYTGVGYFDNFSTYTGIVALILAFYSLRVKKRSVLVLWLGIILALSLSLRTPLSFFLFQNSIAGFSTAVAARAMSLFTFCLSVLAGFGLNHLLQQKKPSLFYFASFSTLILLAWLVPGIAYLKLRDLPGESFTIIQKTTIRNLVIPTFAFVSAFSLLTIKRVLPILPVGFFFILVQFFDLFTFGQKYLSYVQRHHIFPTTPVIEFLQKNAGSDRVSGGDAVPMNMLMPYGLKTASGYEALFSGSYAQFLGKLRGQDIPSGRVGDVVTYPDTFDFNSTATRFILAKKYVKGVPDPNGETHIEFQLPHLKPVFSDGSVQVLENTKRLPLVYLQHKNSQVSPVDYIEHPNGDFDINFESTGLADLIVATSFSPSWSATLDGTDYPVNISNKVYISLLGIQPGKHEIKLTYHPRTFSVALVTSLTSGLIISFLIFFNKKSSV